MFEVIFWAIFKWLWLKYSMQALTMWASAIMQLGSHFPPKIPGKFICWSFFPVFSLFYSLSSCFLFLFFPLFSLLFHTHREMWSNSLHRVYTIKFHAMSIFTMAILNFVTHWYVRQPTVTHSAAANYMSFLFLYEHY